MRKLIPITLLLIFIVSCTDNEFAPSFNLESVEGYKPVYAENLDQQINLVEAQPIIKAGKIYVYNDLLLVNEVGAGIHVFDNTDKFNPIKKYFLNIPGNRDVAIKDGVLYADSFTNLLAIRVAADSAFVIKQIDDVTAAVDVFPPRRGAYFECIDESKGEILRWDYVTLENPQCYRP